MTEYDTYTATYCEWCGELHSASDKLDTGLSGPVHRTEIREFIKKIDGKRPVVETTALEKDRCVCGGQIAQRHYVAGDNHE